MGAKEEMSDKEKRIRSITAIYYSNPKVQESILKFSKDREVVPRYFEGFGKRPDILQYPSDITNVVKRGATSFHGSEELWNDALQLSSELTQKEMSAMRKGWDLLIDIDSPFLDYSKVAALLLLEMFDSYGIHNYGIKFSGSKGFHIIVPSSSFPTEFRGKKMSEMFPEWPRAICQYLIMSIKPALHKKISTEKDIQNLELRTNKKREDLVEAVCPNCGTEMKRDMIVVMQCKLCKTKIEQKRSVLAKKRIFRCVQDDVKMDIVDEKNMLECPQCKTSNFNVSFSPKEKVSSEGRERSDAYTPHAQENIKQKEAGDVDLVLVAPRHLFRMPYSLHEKTSLASVVLKKNEIQEFLPHHADAMKVNVREFLLNGKEGETARLLHEAIEWKQEKTADEEVAQKKVYSSVEFKEVDVKNVEEGMFPPAIKKLLNGLSDGKKRGLFILITFYRSLNFSPEYIYTKVHEWNAKNDPPLREGYVKSQIDWHIRQKKKILPPNYANESFYKDLGLLEKMPETKNPLVDVLRKVRAKEFSARK